ncbi:hypothetical protein SAMN04488057_12160 [Cyclobacterium lianum]|uniref:Uncharacterized protein n=1 Tax=Cyclobacterium lianum TaxID=388280 RepID=A0A1M7QQ81_9BACT|nr:hypothetical protein SAMN04488057_12160 [Cyclobacterium lianum]
MTNRPSLDKINTSIDLLNSAFENYQKYPSETVRKIGQPIGGAIKIYLDVLAS